MNLIVRTIPADHPRPACPAPDDQLARGKYLTAISGCDSCHTPSKHGKKLPDADFAGGQRFPIPGGVSVSANITPDTETGIGAWTAETFVARFKSYKPDSTRPAREMGYQTLMPWTMYSGMTDADLEAIFAYLRTVPPRKNAVTRWQAGK